jgi:hypothetical protein
MVNRRVDHLGDLQPARQEADAPVDLAQALLAIEVVAVFRAVTVAGSPVHDLDDAWRSSSIRETVRHAGARSRRG